MNVVNLKKINRALVLSLTLALLFPLFFNMVLFADVEHPDAQEGRVKIVTGSKEKNVVDISYEDMIKMPIRAAIQGEYTCNVGGVEKKIELKGVSLAYVLKEHCGVDIKDGDVLFKLKGVKEPIPQSYSDILDESHAYVLAYEVDGKPLYSDDKSETRSFNIYKKNKNGSNSPCEFLNVVEISLNAEFKSEGLDANVKFTDIGDEFSYAKYAIGELANKGIINGVKKGEYAPAAAITRAQICKIVVEALGVQDEKYKGVFIDVNDSDWFAQHVASGVKSGLFNGYTDGSFRPNQGINRQELIVVATRAAIKLGVVSEKELETYNLDKSKFEDKSSVGGWATSAVAWLEKKGALDGFTGKRINPLKPANRAEAAQIIYRALY